MRWWFRLGSKANSGLQDSRNWYDRTQELGPLIDLGLVEFAGDLVVADDRGQLLGDILLVSPLRYLDQILHVLRLQTRSQLLNLLQQHLLQCLRLHRQNLQ